MGVREQPKNECQSEAREELQSLERPEVEPSKELLEAFDGLSALRNGLASVAKNADDWAGIPMPIDGLELVIEPTYKYAEGFIKAGLAYTEQFYLDKLKTEGYKLRNEFWSFKYRCRVAVYEHEGKVRFQPIIGSSNAASLALDTMLASEAWGLEQEHRAHQLLAGMLSHRMFKAYLLTGTFLESSKRSGVTYMFRKLRPTIALTKNKYKDSVSILCTLCMHPIGYYQGSWGGAMCPTDDVIAHLQMMRGDEAMFWRRCNQHAPHLPQSGL